jgi:hypothetical protein
VEGVKADRQARAQARSAQQAATEQQEQARRYEEWHADRSAVAVEFLASWDALYSAVITTTNPELVRFANRMHRATQSVFEHLSDEMTADDWYDTIQNPYDPLEQLPRSSSPVYSDQLPTTEPPAHKSLRQGMFRGEASITPNAADDDCWVWRVGGEPCQYPKVQEGRGAFDSGV